MKAKTILIADDEYTARVVLRDRLLVEGFLILEAESGEEAVEVFADKAPDLVLMDVNFGKGIDGFEATRKIKQQCGHRFVPVILCTVRDDVRSKETGLDFGADDYITKPFDLTELVVRVRSMLRIQDLAENNRQLQEKNRELAEREEQLKRENEQLRHHLIWPDPNAPIVGESRAMQQVFRLVEKFAPSSETVLITGETGAGKELIARLIHSNSDRRDRPMQVLDCPSVPETLFESELFGHKKGAFSGAHADRKGILAEGDGSTVLLDEIGEIPVAIQAKLLRFLQDNTVRPVGSNRSRKVDVRILAATNRDLQAMVDEGTFRNDLYYRLSVLRVHVPPLNERWEDIPHLCRSFIRQFNDKQSKNVSGLSAGALRTLERVPFSGNVRELKNIITFAATVAPEGQSIEKEHLAEAMAYFDLRPALDDGNPGNDLKSATEDAERRLIADTLAKFKQDRTRTARALGITRQGLWKKMKRLGLK